MAASRSRAPVGSAPWVLAEQRETAEMISREVEEFQFSVQNDFEWLNEHMASIFAPGNLNVADVFKTPGKLRGKTPRTARKQAAMNRAPLTDIFAPNLAPSSPAKAQNAKSPLQTRVREDVENQYSRPTSPSKIITNPTSKGYPNSDKMDVDIPQQQNNEPTQPISQPTQSNATLMVPLIDEPRSRRTTSDSFVTARENITSRMATEEPVSQTEVMSQPEPMQLDKPLPVPDEPVQQEPAVNDVEMIDDDDLRSPSDGSSPIKPVFRKSSLNFSSLPAREPLAKTSFGARNSQFEKKSFGSLGRTTNGPRTTGTSTMFTEVEKPSVEPVEKPNLWHESSDSTKVASQTSTQRLADMISMLGQSSRGTSYVVPSFDKSRYSQVPSQSEKPHEPTELPKKNDVVDVLRSDNDEDDWIAPIKKPAAVPRPISEISVAKYTSGSIIQVDNDEQRPRYGSPARPFLHKKMASTTLLESPTKASMAPDLAMQKPISVSNPTLGAKATTTPPASPPRSPGSRRLLDGPLSASKAKFYSVLKSAKDLIASSAGVSANAKLAALSPGRVRKQMDEDLPSPTAEIRSRPALFPNMLSESKSGRPASPEGRRLRSSTELKRKEEEDRRRVADDLERVRQRERQKAAEAAAQKMNRAAPPKSAVPRPGPPSRTETEVSKDDDVPPPVPPKTMLPNSKIRDPRRVPVPKVTPKDLASKVRPAPVTVRMPSQRIGHATPSAAPPSTATLSQSLHETLPPPPPPKNGPTKPSTLTNHANASTTSLKSTVSAKRTMPGVAKKKEQVTKPIARKVEQKREFEQKRAQRLEEERKLEQQRKAAELARAQEARKAAQRQAEEVKRKDPQRPESRQNALATALQNERAATQQNHPRGEVASARPASRMNMVPDSNRSASQLNSAKAPKRALPLDTEEHGPQRSAAPRAQPSYQQLDAKRRKTEEEESQPQPQRPSVLAPPIRQSTIKKETSKFTNAYTPSQNKSMFIKTVTAQHQIQHTSKQNEMAKFANGRIPFADSASSTTQSSQVASQSFKTPARPVTTTSQPTTAAKSSPRYPASELIELPEIMTDSEDEDDENEFQAPSWAESPALRKLLSDQQLVDPESIFGPIGPIKMDEIFANSERQKKFRDRTSSAHWSSLDRLNDEERKKDREARERLMKDGGWDFMGQKAALGDNSPRP